MKAPKKQPGKTGPKRRNSDPVPWADAPSFFAPAVQDALISLQRVSPPGTCILAWQDCEGVCRRWDRYPALGKPPPTGLELENLKASAWTRIGKLHGRFPGEVVGLLAALTEFHARGPREWSLQDKVAFVSIVATEDAVLPSGLYAPATAPRMADLIHQVFGEQNMNSDAVVNGQIRRDLKNAHEYRASVMERFTQDFLAL